MPRILYTSCRAGETSPGLIEASELGSAERTLEDEGHTAIRFWSHPHFGDVPGEDAENAWRRVAKPSATRTWVLVGMASLLTPACVMVWGLAIAQAFGVMIDLPDGVNDALGLAVPAGLLLTLPLFSQLRRELDHRGYRRARLLLWLLWATVPFVAPLFVLWAVRLETARSGVEAALRPYRWLRLVSQGIFDALHGVALDEAKDRAGRIALCRKIAQERPSPMNSVQLALDLLIHFHDVEGAKAALMGLDEGKCSAAVKAARQLVLTLICIEEGKGEQAVRRASAVGRAFVAAGGAALSPGWTGLIDATSARAFALHGDTDAAERFLRQAAPPLLFGGSHDVLDAAAAAVRAAAEARRTE